MDGSWLYESDVEEAALHYFHDLGWQVVNGPEIAPDGDAPERADYSAVLLLERLRRAVATLNPELGSSAVDEVVRKVQASTGPSLVAVNREIHRMVVDGVPVEIRRPDGSTGYVQARLIDFDDVEANDWLVANQYSVKDGDHVRRPDVVVFVNGIPLAVFELKNAADPQADIHQAFRQLQTYKSQIPSLMRFAEVLVVSDGLVAQAGTITSGAERFMPWKTIEGETLAPEWMPQLEVLVRGMFDRRRFLDLIRHFIVFEDAGDGGIAKKVAGYHQFHAVNRAVEQTLRASAASDAALLAAEDGAGEDGGALGDHRIGVVWHTQGSGKSLTMAFYSGRIVSEPLMRNPTIVVITDRNDLDDQLFGTFSRCQDLLRQPPEQAKDRQDLRAKLRRAAGGVVFTTVHKFFPDERGRDHPLLSDRSNIVVIADEAHRSQYDFIDGYARHMREALPNASFIGFTGTPIESTDKSTKAVFGEHISVYDIQRAVDDGATVPIYYEGRLAKLSLDEDARPHLDAEFEEVTESEEVDKRERLKTKWAQLETIAGTPERLAAIAADLVAHFESRQEVLDGKAMVVVMSRRIAAELYDEIIKLHPEWHSEDDSEGALKVIMTGSVSDPLEWQGHIRNKPRREALANRFKDPSDGFKIAIVRDMWLTGFDAPSLHTMYVDKPMKGHGLMQAIARVNRVFKDKPGGLVVDYLGLADELKRALADYTDSGGRGSTTFDQREAIAYMLEKHEVACGIMHPFDWSEWKTAASHEKLTLINRAALEQVLGQPDGKQRFLQVEAELSRAFALAVPSPEALAIRDDVAFFQAIAAALRKGDGPMPGAGGDVEGAIRQLVSRAVVSDGIIDIFAAAGLDRPDISVLSDEFLEEVKHLPQKNLAVEALRRLLNDQIRVRFKKNVVQARSFADLLDASIRKYQNRAIEAAQVIEELIELAKQMQEAQRRGEELGLSDDEVAFYDALVANESAVAIMGDDKLKMLAAELVREVRGKARIDWTMKETVKAEMRVAVKHLLRKYGYPPDMEKAATITVIEQAELLSAGWVEIEY